MAPFLCVGVVFAKNISPHLEPLLKSQLSLGQSLIVHADDLPSSDIHEIVAIAEKNALSTRRFTLHNTSLFIKQQAGGIFVELYFIFSDSKQSKDFCSQHLNECAKNHRFKFTFVNAFVIDVSARDVVINKRPIGMFQGNLGRKLREKLFL